MSITHCYIVRSSLADVKIGAEYGDTFVLLSVDNTACKLRPDEARAVAKYLIRKANVVDNKDSIASGTFNKKRPR